MESLAKEGPQPLSATPSQSVTTWPPVLTVGPHSRSRASARLLAVTEPVVRCTQHQPEGVQASHSCCQRSLRRGLRMAGSDHVLTSHRAAVTFPPPSHCAPFPQEFVAQEWLLLSRMASVGARLAAAREPRSHYTAAAHRGGLSPFSLANVEGAAQLLSPNLAARSLLHARNFVHGSSHDAAERGAGV